MTESVCKVEGADNRVWNWGMLSLSAEISGFFKYELHINPLAPEFSFKFEHTLYIKRE